MAVQKEKEEASHHGPTHRLTPTPPKQGLFSSNVSLFMHCNSKEEQKVSEEEEDDEEDHFRHRRLTGDSGIEVCRCHVKREEQKEEVLQKGHFSQGQRGEERADMLHDSMDCSFRAKAAVQCPLLDECTEKHGRLSSPPGVIQKTREAVITVETS